ncbi:MDR family MFS transporter [Frigoribacterium sp. 2-23]|uniref:MDR family MFS transporter n=1 Tax=Frigoribacterium sp. 2-23 TaxID=3415006 RepID=UPI003C6F8A3F
MTSDTAQATADPTPTGSVPTDSVRTGDHTVDAATGARNKLVIGLLLVSAFVVILNETIMSVALPSLTRDLGITVTAGQWLTTGFLLTMAVVIPITGFLLQRFNTRPVYITAMSLFSLGTLISATAPGFGMLLVGRIVQATGTAIMMPLLMTTVLTLVPPATRGRTMGNISIVISVAPAIGPTISGIILNFFEWRFMFILVLPIAVAALIVGTIRMKNVTTPRNAPLDVLSVIVSAFAFGGIVYGLSTIGEGHDAAVPAWVPLVVGGVAMVAFVVRQRWLQKKDDALLDLRTFGSRTFTMSTITLGIAMIALFGTLIVLPIYLQNVHGLEPLFTGLLLLPGGLVMGLLSPIVGRLFDRFGPTVLLVPGTILVSAVLWALTLVSETTPIPLVMVAHITLSIGLALIFTPLFTSGLGSLTPKLYSHGSAIIGTVQQVAGAAGTAVFITAMTLATTTAAASGGAGQVESVATGVRAAFLIGAIISLFAIVGAFFVRRPATEPGQAPAPMGH